MIRFQFQIDGRSFGSPIRATWEEAAADAVSAGYAVWAGHNQVRLDEAAEIVRLKWLDMKPADATPKVRK